MVQDFWRSVYIQFSPSEELTPTRVPSDWESSPPTSDPIQVTEHALGEIQLSLKHLKVRVLFDNSAQNALNIG